MEEESSKASVQRMLEFALERSETGLPIAGEESVDSVVFMDGMRRFGVGHSSDTHGEIDMSAVKRDLATGVAARPVEEGSSCSIAKTVLLVPFSFYPGHDECTPAEIAAELLQRRVPAQMGLGDDASLWERTTLSKDVTELAPYFRQQLGFPAEEGSPVQRLRLTSEARDFLFGNARLWATTKSGDEAGKFCGWSALELVIYPHAAILSVHLDWCAGGAESAAPIAFTLADLRTWVYVSKFRHDKPGTTRGWTFAQHVLPVSSRRTTGTIRGNTKKAGSAISRELGLRMYAALYGGAGIPLQDICNWLVKMPREDAGAMPQRVSKHETCLHFSFAVVERAPRADKLEEYMFHIWRACRADDTTTVPPAHALSDQLSMVRENIGVGMGREGVFGLAWGAKMLRSFQRHFFGLYFPLMLHCLSERFTLDKLSYLVAVGSAQHLPGSTEEQSPSERDLARRQLLALSLLLVKYRSCMASDDCGGRSEVREFFQVVRRLFKINVLKRQLGESVQDMLAVVDREWMSERRAEKKKDTLWKLKRDELQKRVVQARRNTSSLFDVASNGFGALGLPVMLIVNLFSINMPSVPTWVPWAQVIYISSCAAALLVVVFLIIYFGQRRSLQALRAEKSRLDREWKETQMAASPEIAERLEPRESPRSEESAKEDEEEREAQEDDGAMAREEAVRAPSVDFVRNAQFFSNDPSSARKPSLAARLFGRVLRGSSSSSSSEEDDGDDRKKGHVEMTPIGPAEPREDHKYIDEMGRGSFSIDIQRPLIFIDREEDNGNKTNNNNNQHTDHK